MKYDFLLFENYQLASNHKIDVVLIARLLRSAGMSVAILDIYKEDQVDDIEGIPVVHHHVSMPPGLFQRHDHEGLIRRKFYEYVFYKRRSKYLKRVLEEVEPLADRFYCGSYYLGMSSLFFDIKKPCFYWGLRSNRMSAFWTNFIHEGFAGRRMIYLKYKFLSNPYQFLFVSNDIILREFISVGIPPNRMIIREERCIDRIGNTFTDKLAKDCLFLTIGKLRPSKHVELIVEAFSQLNSSVKSNLVLAGKASDDYEKVITQALKGVPRTERYNRYFEYDDFLEFYGRSHFVVFADEKPQYGTVTNGTMTEALIHYRPIIAPNYSPYSEYVTKYGVGLLYEPGNIESMKEAMKKAVALGCESFFLNIEVFLKTILYDRVSENLYQSIIKLHV